MFAQIGKNFSSAVPTKIFEYLASSRKILLGLPEGQAKEIFKNFYGIKIFEAGNNEELFKNFEAIKELKYESYMAKKNKIVLSTKFIREENIINYLEFLQKSFKDHS